MIVTIFQDLSFVSKPFYRSVKVALDRIANGANKDLIERIRKADTKGKQNALKKKLPCILFSGKFRQRNSSNLLLHSGLICMDLDDVDVEKAIRKLKKDEYVYSAFVSPSGKGVKFLVKIPTNNHLGSFYALQERYPNIDISGKDVSRICFESYDPDLYLNENSKVFTKQIEISFENSTVDTPMKDKDKVYELIKIWMDKQGIKFIRSSRNAFLTKLIHACNRFGIPKQDARDYALMDYVSGDSSFAVSELDSIVKSIYANYSSKFDTASFEESQVVDTETRKVVSNEILDMTKPPKDIIYLKDVRKDMDEAFDKGIPKGDTTHFELIDRIYRLQRGEITLLHGIGNHGKSTMLKQLMLNRAVHDSNRWCIFTPEEYPAVFFYRDLQQMYIGKSVLKDSPNRMTKAEHAASADFVNEHFLYLFPEKDDPTPEYILSRLEEAIIKENVDGVVIDPFNQMHHVYAEREDQYLSKILSEFKRFAVLNNVYFYVVAHPNNRLAKTDEGDLAMPYYTSIAGGMMWSSKLDNILCYHRPYYASDPKSPECQLASQKIKKQQINGIPGTVNLEFDRSKYRYYEKSEAGKDLTFTLQNPLDTLNPNADIIPNRNYNDVPF